MRALQWKEPIFTTGLGITTNSFESPLRQGQISLQEWFCKAAERGFSWVELRDQQVELTPVQCQEIQRWAQQLHMRVHYAWNNENVTQEDQVFERALKNAAEFGPGVLSRIVLAPGWVSGRPGYPLTRLEELCDSVNRRIRQAWEKGVTLCFENSMEPIGGREEGAGMEELFHGCPDMVTAMDAANFTTQVTGGFATTGELVEYIGRNPQRIPYFHLKTACGHRPVPDIQLEGDFSLRPLLQALGNDPQRWICLELPAQENLQQVWDNVDRSIQTLQWGGMLRG
ncbi:MAG: sugar phosphate isomerase/epimerase family protein [Eubacteriales bacterium]|jgi:sugar phosphate isomerase/epimerase